jgi:hypothetical protein
MTRPGTTTNGQPQMSCQEWQRLFRTEFLGHVPKKMRAKWTQHGLYCRACKSFIQDFEEMVESQP